MRCSECDTTTRSKAADCWKMDPPLCGKCAAKKYPHLYTKGNRGHDTGGRHGVKQKNSLSDALIEDMVSS